MWCWLYQNNRQVVIGGCLPRGAGDQHDYRQGKQTRRAAAVSEVWDTSCVFFFFDVTPAAQRWAEGPGGQHQLLERWARACLLPPSAFFQTYVPMVTVGSSIGSSGPPGTILLTGFAVLISQQGFCSSKAGVGQKIPLDRGPWRTGWKSAPLYFLSGFFHKEPGFSTRMLDPAKKNSRRKDEWKQRELKRRKIFRMIPAVKRRLWLGFRGNLMWFRVLAWQASQKNIRIWLLFPH